MEAEGIKHQVDTLKDKILSKQNFGPPIQTLKDQINALTQLAVATGVSIDFTDLVNSLLVKESEQEFQKTKRITEIYAQYNEQKEKLPIEKLEERQEAVNKIYSVFNSVYEQSRSEQKEDNKNLQVLYKVLQENGGLTPEEKKNLQKTTEEIEESKARIRAIELANQVANEEHIHHKKELEEVKKREQNLNHLPEDDFKRVLLAKRKEHHQKGLDSANEIIGQYNNFHEERKQVAHNICVIKQLAMEKRKHEKLVQDFAETFYKIHGAQPEDLANELKVEGNKQKEFIIFYPSEIQNSPTALERPDSLSLQQKDNSQTFIKKSNKQNKSIDNMRSNFGQKVKIQQSDNSLIPTDTPNTTDQSKRQGKGRVSRLSI